MVSTIRARRAAPHASAPVWSTLPIAFAPRPAEICSMFFAKLVSLRFLALGRDNQALYPLAYVPSHMIRYECWGLRMAALRRSRRH